MLICSLQIKPAEPILIAKTESLSLIIDLISVRLICLSRKYIQRVFVT